MRRYFLLALLLLPTASLAQTEAPVDQLTGTISSNQFNIIKAALEMAPHLCGDDGKDVACVIGLQKASVEAALAAWKPVKK